MSNEKKIINDNSIDLSKLVVQSDDKPDHEVLDLKKVRMINDHEVELDPNDVLTDEKADLILTQLLKHQTDDIIPMTDKNGVIIGYRRKLI